ncbi:MAG: tetratricopeptide repeat protein, partial [Gemmatimonadetes bacterium]|nr:tetratricopeptide repeat protein [Gemmatimonadota bacterium]
DYSRAVLDGDLDKARATIRRAAELAPGSKAVYNWALMAVRIGRPVEAREALGSLHPDRGVMRDVSRYWIRLIEASHQLGDHVRELEEVRELATRHPDDRSVLFQNVRVLAAMGEADSLQALFRSRRMTGLRPEIVSRRYRNAAVELFAHGHDAEAREMATQGIRWIDRSLPATDRLSALNVGVDITGVRIDITARDEAMYQRARLLELLSRKEEALAAYEDLLETNPRAWWLRGHRGVMLAWMGDEEGARTVDSWLQSSTPEYGASAVTLWRAGIAARLGEHKRAVALLQRARLEGRIWDSLHAWFHLYDALGDDPAFQRFMAPQG